MYDSTVTASGTAAPPRRRRTWLRIFLTGFFLWVLTAVVTFLTGNPNLVPTLVLLGSFLVPVSFVVWAFGRRHSGEVTAELLFSTFVTGGVLGVLASSLLEAYGYAFTALFTESGLSLAQLVQTEPLRGLLAPVGHGLWTAMLGGVLFSASGRRHFAVTRTVVAGVPRRIAAARAVGLHAQHRADGDAAADRHRVPVRPARAGLPGTAHGHIPVTA
jgi:RsiW-degrading membrane proteinase PrsW (M82 family)